MDTTYLAQGRERDVWGMTLGVILCFIPPFIWGIIVILVVLKKSRGARWSLSPEVLFYRGWHRFALSEYTIPVSDIVEVIVGRADLQQWLFGVRNVGIEYRHGERITSVMLYCITNARDLERHLATLATLRPRSA